MVTLASIAREKGLVDSLQSGLHLEPSCCVGVREIMVCKDVMIVMEDPKMDIC